MRGDKPFVFTNLKDDTGLDTVIDFIVDRGMLSDRAVAAEASRQSIGPGT